MNPPIIYQGDSNDISGCHRDSNITSTTTTTTTTATTSSLDVLDQSEQKQSGSTQVKDAWKIIASLANRLKFLESLYKLRDNNPPSDVDQGIQ